ncbi:RNA polymerase subunit sigma-70 [Hyalangium sp.]|uniref:RNA polymerase subunit sigma-70 n=1 Tax=Hyalangium sp. TaxID=2028555 RepID=UPI00389AA087
MFLANTGVRFAPPTPAEVIALGELLLRAWKDARAQWPTVELPLKDFVIYLARRIPEPGSNEPFTQLLAKRSLGELYLTCACLQGMASAHEAFERNYLAKLPAKLKRLKQPDATIEDVCQLTRVKLLVQTPESAPKLGTYTGRGALLSWVIVTAGRIATKLRAADKSGPDDDWKADILQVPASGNGEWDFIQQRFHADFRLAVREACSTLGAEDRHLLRLYFAHRLSTYQLAPLFRVNQATIVRWLQSARQHVYEETRRYLQERLGLSTQDLDSHLVYVNSKLDLSISQLLGEKSVGASPITTPPPVATTPPPIATTPPPIPPKNG